MIGDCCRALESVLMRSRIVVVCGTGGVGKTTVSAALGLGAALRGRKSVVMTIDPAHRLSDSLEIPDQRGMRLSVPLQGLNPAPGGSLEAIQLDAKQTLDRLINDRAPSPAVAQRIFSSPLYQHGARALIESPEYLAVEKLYEIDAEPGTDLLVIDTPPLRHAIEFLTAPARMIAFIEKNRMLAALRRPAASAGRVGRSLLGLGGASLIRLLRLVAGSTLVGTVSDFFRAIEGLYDGFRDRARRVEEILSDRRTALVLVCSAEETSLRLGIDVTRSLRLLGLPLRAVIVNRAHLPPSAELEKAPWPLPTPDSPPEEIVPDLKALESSLLALSALARYDREQIEIIRSEIADRMPLVVAAEQAQEVIGLARLERLQGLLLGPRPSYPPRK